MSLSLLLLGMFTASPAKAAHILCALDSSTRTLTVTNPGSGVTIANGYGYLVVNDVSCAVISELNQVRIDMTMTANTRLTFYLSTGPLGPGYTDEGNGSSELEFDVTGIAADADVDVQGSTSSSNGVAVGERVSPVWGITEQINLNSIADGGTPDVDVSMQGAPDDFRIYGGFGDDVLSGAGTGTFGSRMYPHPLLLIGNGGADRVSGGAGDDDLDGGTGADQVTAGAGDDLLWVPDASLDGPDVYSGGDGSDTAAAVGTTQGVRASLTLDGQANDGAGCPGSGCDGDNLMPDLETVRGSSSDEIIAGGAGSQTLEGSIGVDQLSGGGGNDKLWGGEGPDILGGGEGLDTAFFADEGAGIQVSLNGTADDGFPGEGDNVKSDVEKVIGSPFADTFTGNAGVNSFYGQDGPDLLYGRKGDDLLYGRKGDDTFNGGPGTDLCEQGPGSGSETFCEL